MDVGGRVRERTCDQEPGAAQRSTTRVTLEKRLKWELSWRSLKAERARQPGGIESQWELTEEMRGESLIYLALLRDDSRNLVCLY